MPFIQHPRNTGLAEILHDRVAVVGVFRQAEACSQRADNSVIDLDVQVLRANGELQLHGCDQTSKNRRHDGDWRRRNAVILAGRPAGRWQYSRVVQ